MLANALLPLPKLRRRRRSARRSSVFGNALGNAAVRGLQNYSANKAKAAWAADQAARDKQLMMQDDPSLAASAGAGSFLDRYPDALASNDGMSDPLNKYRQAMLDAGTLSNSNPDTDYYVDMASQILACPKDSGTGGCYIVGPALDIGLVSGYEPTIAELEAAIVNEQRLLAIELAKYESVHSQVEALQTARNSQYSAVPGMRELTAAGGALYGVGRGLTNMVVGTGEAIDDILIGIPAMWGSTSGFSLEAQERTANRVDAFNRWRNGGHMVQEFFAPMGERLVTGANLIIEGQYFEGGARIGEGFTQIGLLADGGMGTARVGGRGMVSAIRAADEAGLLPAMSRSGPSGGRQIGAVGELESQIVAPRSTVGDGLANKAGTPYPEVIDPRSGLPIPHPGNGLKVTPKADRVAFGPKERGSFIKEWYDRGYSTPTGGWRDYDIHHITPKEYGGTNAFDNLVPVPREIHQKLFNPWWQKY